MIIALSGMMGVGKTSIGRELSAFIGAEFVDLDEFLVSSAGMSVNEIFSTFGESHFRNLEMDALSDIVDSRSSVADDREGHVVISLGGGTPMQKRAGEILEHAVKIYLKASPEYICSNLRTYGYSDRPILRNLDYDGLYEKIKKLYEQRNPVYERFSDISVDVEGYRYAGPGLNLP